MNVFAVFAIVAALAGQTRSPQPLYEFSKLKTFRCDFTESEGRRLGPMATPSAKRETFSDLVLDAINYQARTARFVGNAGSEMLQVIDGEGIVSFVEVTGSGNVNVLSIFKTTASLDRYKAAYARHAVFSDGNIAMTQSYGECRGLQ